MRKVVHISLLLFFIVFLGCAAATSATGPIKPRIYNMDYETVFSKAIIAASDKKWSIQFTDKETGIIAARSGFNMLTSGDNISIRINKREDGKTEVNVTSSSPGTLLDLGKNERNVQDFLLALDKQLGVEPPENKRKRMMFQK